MLEKVCESFHNHIYINIFSVLISFKCTSTFFLKQVTLYNKFSFVNFFIQIAKKLF